jgi:hypothetical protein
MKIITIDKKEWKKFLRDNPDYVEELLHDAILGCSLAGKITKEEFEGILKMEDLLAGLNFFGDE